MANHRQLETGAPSVCAVGLLVGHALHVEYPVNRGNHINWTLLEARHKNIPVKSCKSIERAPKRFWMLSASSRVPGEMKKKTENCVELPFS